MSGNHNDENKTGLTEYPVTIDQLQPSVFIRITGFFRAGPTFFDEFNELSRH
jgi:hypothetical protein